MFISTWPAFQIKPIVFAPLFMVIKYESGAITIRTLARILIGKKNL